MTTSPVTTRLRRGLAVSVTVAVGAFGITIVAPPAQAATGSLTYTCTGDAVFDLPVVVDTNAPARLYLSEKADIVAAAGSALPGFLADSRYGSGARSFDGTVVARVTVGTTALDVSHAIAKTGIPAPRTQSAAVPFVATSAALPFTAPATPGGVDIKAGDLTATLNFYDGVGAPSGDSLTVTCKAPPGQAPVVDTIAVVTKSVTTLTLSKTASQYGEDVTATAKVTTTAGAAGPADGDVAFSVDGVVTRAKVDKDGVAALVLPDAAVGAHSVTATFVPRDTAHYDGSTAAQAWEVSKVRTKMRVPVSGKRVGTVTKVGVRAQGAFDTVPTGKVTVKLKRVNSMKKWIKVRKLDDQGSAAAGFGELKKGRYKVVVTYKGDTNHNAKKKVKRFRVKRG